jgi:hypothetical protein
MTDESPAIEWLLAAQTPAIPPDETPGLLTLRPLSAEETRQCHDDAALVKKVARAAPYQRAVTAYHQLFEAVQKTDTIEGSRPSARAAGALSRGLSAVAHALRELPEALQRSLEEDLPGDDGLYRLAMQLDALDAGRLTLLREEEGVELVAASGDAAAWVKAAGLDHGPDVIGILTTIERAIDDAARLVAHWLLAQRGLIDGACRRLAALDGEVFQGASCIIEMTSSEDEVSERRITNLLPLPLDHLYASQYAIAQAAQVLDVSDRLPAVRGPRAMPAETIEAIVRAQIDEADPEPLEPPQGRDRPIDMPSLIAHLQLGAMRLERAWSQALDREDVATLAGEWESLLRSLVGEIQHDDEKLPEADRHLDLPPTIGELATLIAEPGRVDGRLRVAQAIAVADLVALVPSLTEPTNRLVDGAGRRLEWFSSGAFANVRQLLALVTTLLELGEPAASSSLHLAALSRLRADPLAEVLHLSRALRAIPTAGMPGEGTDERIVLDQLRDLARRIGNGADVELAHAFLCALAAREVLRDRSADA